MDVQENVEVLEDISAPCGIFNVSDCAPENNEISSSYSSKKSKDSRVVYCDALQELNDSFKIRKLVSINSQSSSSDGNSSYSVGTPNVTRMLCQRSILTNGNTTVVNATQNTTIPHGVDSQGHSITHSAGNMSSELVLLDDVEIPSFCTDSTVNSTELLASLSPALNLESPVCCISNAGSAAQSAQAPSVRSKMLPVHSLTFESSTINATLVQVTDNVSTKQVSGSEKRPEKGILPSQDSNSTVVISSSANLNNLDVSRTNLLHTTMVKNIFAQDAITPDSPLFNAEFSKDVDIILGELRGSGEGTNQNDDSDDSNSILDLEDFNFATELESVESDLAVFAANLDWKCHPGQGSSMKPVENFEVSKECQGSDLTAISAVTKSETGISSSLNAIESKLQLEASSNVTSSTLTKHGAIGSDGAIRAAFPSEALTSSMKCPLIKPRVFLPYSAGIRLVGSRASVSFGPTSVIPENDSECAYNHVPNLKLAQAKPLNSTFETEDNVNMEGNVGSLNSGPENCATFDESVVTKRALNNTFDAHNNACSAVNCTFNASAASATIVNSTFDGVNNVALSVIKETESTFVAGHHVNANSTYDCNDDKSYYESNLRNTTLCKQNNGCDAILNNDVQNLTVVLPLESGKLKSTFEREFKIGHNGRNQPHAVNTTFDGDSGKTTKLNCTFEQKFADNKFCLANESLDEYINKDSSVTCKSIASKVANTTFDQLVSKCENTALDQPSSKCANCTFDQPSKGKFPPSPIQIPDQEPVNILHAFRGYSKRNLTFDGSSCKSGGHDGTFLKQSQDNANVSLSAPVTNYMMNRSLSMPCPREQDEELLDHLATSLCQNQSYSCINIMDADFSVLGHILHMEPSKQQQLRQLYCSPAGKQNTVSKHRRSLPHNMSMCSYSLANVAQRMDASFSGPSLRRTPSEDVLHIVDSQDDLVVRDLTTSTPKPSKSVQEILSLYKQQKQSVSAAQAALSEQALVAGTKQSSITQLLNRYQPLASLPETGADNKHLSHDETECTKMVPDSTLVVNNPQSIAAKLRYNRQQQGSMGSAEPVRPRPVRTDFVVGETAAALRSQISAAGPIKGFPVTEAQKPQRLPLKPSASTPEEPIIQGPPPSSYDRPQGEHPLSSRPAERSNPLPSFGSFSSIDSERPISPDLASLGSNINPDKFACSLDFQLPSGSIGSGCRTSTPAPNSSRPLHQDNIKSLQRYVVTPGSGCSGGSSNIKKAIFKQQQQKRLQEQAMCTPPLPVSQANNVEEAVTSPTSDVLQQALHYDTPPTAPVLSPGSNEAAKMLSSVNKWHHNQHSASHDVPVSDCSEPDILLQNQGLEKMSSPREAELARGNVSSVAEEAEDAPFASPLLKDTSTSDGSRRSELSRCELATEITSHVTSSTNRTELEQDKAVRNESSDLSKVSVDSGNETRMVLPRLKTRGLESAEENCVATSLTNFSNSRRGLSTSIQDASCQDKLTVITVSSASKVHAKPMKISASQVSKLQPQTVRPTALAKPGTFVTRFRANSLKQSSPCTPHSPLASTGCPLAVKSVPCAADAANEDTPTVLDEKTSSEGNLPSKNTDISEAVGKADVLRENIRPRQSIIAVKSTTGGKASIVAKTRTSVKAPVSRQSLLSTVNKTATCLSTRRSLLPNGEAGQGVKLKNASKMSTENRILADKENHPSVKVLSSGSNKPVKKSLPSSCDMKYSRLPSLSNSSQVPAAGHSAADQRVSCPMEVQRRSLSNLPNDGNLTRPSTVRHSLLRPPTRVAMPGCSVPSRLRPPSVLRPNL